MKEKKYTIKDIAALAGVSKGTVDRVLHKRGKVSKKALDAINNVLKKIDYQPNLIARNLKINKTYHICVLIPDPNEDPYWQYCVDGINEAVKEFKPLGIFIQTFYFSPNSTKSFLDINKTILELSPDAVLLTPLFYKETLKIIDKYSTLNTIVSTFNNQINSTQVANFVGQDLYKSGRVAARLMHLITPDASEIFIIHFDEILNNALHMQEKEKGFRSYFDNLDSGNYKITTHKIKDSDFEENLTKLLAKNSEVTGVFVTTSKTFKVASSIKKNKTTNIKLIGYDLLDENIHFLNEGIIHFLINQNPKGQTYFSLTYLIEHFLFDKNIPIQKLLPIDIVNAENLSSYLNN